MFLIIKDVAQTPSGGLSGRARVTGFGVMDYPEYDSKVFRPEDVTFDPKSLESLKRLSITNGHPPVSEVDGENYSDFAVGTTGSDIRRVDDDVEIDFSIWDTKLAFEILRRLSEGDRVQWSVGAKGPYVMEDGSFKGESYNIRLTGLFYNHLAVLIDWDGRHPTTDITDQKTDGQQMMVFIDSKPHQKTEELTVKFNLLNGVEIDLVDALAQHVKNQQAEHLRLADENKTMKGELSAAQKQLEKAQSLALTDEKLSAEMTKRLQTAAEASQVLGVDVNTLIGMNDEAIQTKVALANGYTEDELKLEDAATLRGIYKQIVKGANLNISDAVRQSGHAGSGAYTPPPAGGNSQMIIEDSAADAFADADAALANAYKESR